MFSPMSMQFLDFNDRGAMCSRQMSANERTETTSYPLVLVNPTSTMLNMSAPPDRFQSRYHALGYYLDPRATGFAPAVDTSSDSAVSSSISALPTATKTNAPIPVESGVCTA